MHAGRAAVQQVSLKKVGGGRGAAAGTDMGGVVAERGGVNPTVLPVDLNRLCLLAGGSPALKRETKNKDSFAAREGPHSHLSVAVKGSEQEIAVKCGLYQRTFFCIEGLS